MGAIKDMFKTVVLAVIVAMLCVGAVALSGCSSRDDSEFVGKWTTTRVNDNDYGLTSTNAALVVSQDGTFRLDASKTGNVFGTNYGSNSVSGTWKTVGNKLYCYRSDVASHLEFLLSDDGSTLVDVTDASFVLYRSN